MLTLEKAEAKSKYETLRDAAVAASHKATQSGRLVDHIEAARTHKEAGKHAPSKSPMKRGHQKLFEEHMHHIQHKSAPGAKEAILTSEGKDIPKAGKVEMKEQKLDVKPRGYPSKDYKPPTSGSIGMRPTGSINTSAKKGFLDQVVKVGQAVGAIAKRPGVGKKTFTAKKKKKDPNFHRDNPASATTETKIIHTDKFKPKLKQMSAKSSTPTWFQKASIDVNFQKPHDPAHAAFTADQHKKVASWHRRQVLWPSKAGSKMSPSAVAHDEHHETAARFHDNAAHILTHGTAAEYKEHFNPAHVKNHYGLGDKGSSQMGAFTKKSITAAMTTDLKKEKRPGSVPKAKVPQTKTTGFAPVAKKSLPNWLQKAGYDTASDHIGTTRSGKKIMGKFDHESHKDFDIKDHRDAMNAHTKKIAHYSDKETTHVNTVEKPYHQAQLDLHKEAKNKLVDADQKKSLPNWLQKGLYDEAMKKQKAKRMISQTEHAVSESESSSDAPKPKFDPGKHLSGDAGAVHSLKMKLKPHMHGTQKSLPEWMQKASAVVASKEAWDASKAAMANPSAETHRAAIEKHSHAAAANQHAYQKRQVRTPTRSVLSGGRVGTDYKGKVTQHQTRLQHHKDELAKLTKSLPEWVQKGTTGKPRRAGKAKGSKKQTRAAKKKPTLAMTQPSKFKTKQLKGRTPRMTRLKPSRVRKSLPEWFAE